MRHFCTIFDHTFLPHAQALHTSLMQHAADGYTLYALCLDMEAYEAIAAAPWPGVEAIPLSVLEAADPELTTARAGRTKAEYCFTLAPAFPNYVLQRHPGIDVLAYVDADLWFFSDTNAIDTELGAGSVLIVPYRNRAIRPTYNVGLVVFRNDARGRQCLSWWRTRCIEWCFARHEDGKFADEGYLEHWPSRFEGVVVAQHPGIGLAPWNVGERTIEHGLDGVYVDGKRVVFFHFAGVRRRSRRVVHHNLAAYGVRMTRPIRDLLYAPYIRTLLAASDPAGGTVAWQAAAGVRHGLRTRVIHALQRGSFIQAGRQLFTFGNGTALRLLLAVQRRWRRAREDGRMAAHR